jgi:hypothetical protein
MSIKLLDDIAAPKDLNWYKAMAKEGRRCAWIIIHQLAGEPDHYWNGSVFSHRLGDPGDAEKPKRFKTLAGAENCCNKFSQLTNNEKIAYAMDPNAVLKVAFWTAPEQGDKPLDKHVRTTGHQFPGSPSQ